MNDLVGSQLLRRRRNVERDFLGPAQEKSEGDIAVTQGAQGTGYEL
jgi:hypothetical protein